MKGSGGQMETTDAHHCDPVENSTRIDSKSNGFQCDAHIDFAVSQKSFQCLEPRQGWSLPGDRGAVA